MVADSAYLALGNDWQSQYAVFTQQNFTSIFAAASDRVLLRRWPRVNKIEFRATVDGRARRS